MPIKCCNGCVPPKRHTACWGHCPEYAREKAQHDERMAARRQQQAIQDGIFRQKYKGVIRANRKKGRK